MALKKKERTLDIERGSTRSHASENSFCKKRRTCSMTDYKMDERSLFTSWKRTVEIAVSTRPFLTSVLF